MKWSIDEKVLIGFIIVSFIVLSIGAFTYNFGLMMISLPVAITGGFVTMVVQDVEKRRSRE